MPEGKDMFIKNYGTLHSFKTKFGSEEFPHQAGSTDVR